MPGYVSTFKVIDDAINSDVAINVRGKIVELSSKKKFVGLGGDGRIGSTGIVNGNTIITADKDFYNALVDLGADARLLK